jgi:hypothetical protein
MTWIAAVASVLDDEQRSTVTSALRDANGNWSKASSVLQERLPAAVLAKVRLVNTLAEWSDDNVALVGDLVGRGLRVIAPKNWPSALAAVDRSACVQESKKLKTGRCHG